ncbi:hypothetical protein BU16DRAFT_578734 [Lophium mytilinum]|uniref:F-box domain-containing protein n=1 Tax=Lophium mytilinum TaxID=390894 RepID=A0A6A6R8D3_9PEZI|nr:hypothetical protein BU16DRAFT_578734 [Lophium mytilinum]
MSPSASYKPGDTALILGATEGMSSFVSSLLKDPASLHAISTISIENPDRTGETGDEEEARLGRPQEEFDADMAEFSRSLIALLDAIHQGGKLKAFKWTGETLGAKTRRPVEFWPALWKHANTLEKLELDFCVREVENFIPPSTPIPLLTTLRLDVGSAHGDNGSTLNPLLAACPAVKNLTLSLPTCDLEGCRIQKLDWAWTYPALTTLSLSVFSEPFAPVTAFLARHPGIATLTWGADTDWNETTEADALPSTILPNLTALNVNSRPSGLDALLSEEAGRNITHFRDAYFGPSAEIFKIAAALRCLELQPHCRSWRPEDPLDSDDSDEPEDPGERAPGRLAALLPKLPELQELAVEFDTGAAFYRWGPENAFQNAPAMDARDLESVIEILPAESKLRVLRVVDDRAEELGVGEVDFRGVPVGLEYIKWEGKRRVLYKLEREEGGVRLVECQEGLRVVGTEEKGGWTEGRVLVF